MHELCNLLEKKMMLGNSGGQLNEPETFETNGRDVLTW